MKAVNICHYGMLFSFAYSALPVLKLLEYQSRAIYAINSTCHAVKDKTIQSWKCIGVSGTYEYSN